jgi:hypothetical protein
MDGVDGLFAAWEKREGDHSAASATLAAVVGARRSVWDLPACLSVARRQTCGPLRTPSKMRAEPEALHAANMYVALHVLSRILR